MERENNYRTSDERVVMGTYAETIIATREHEAELETEDHGWYIYGQLVVLLYCFIGFFLTTAYIVYFTWDYIGLIVAGFVIGLGFAACRYYGTNRSILDRFRYRTVTVVLTDKQRTRIKRRLSGIFGGSL